MGITTNGLSVCAAALTGSAVPTHCAIGIGSSIFASGNTALGSEVERNLYSTSDLSASEQVTFVTDWSPVEVSGLVIKEHGMFNEDDIMLNREVLTGSLVFTGEEELQIQQTFKFYT